MSKGVYSSRFTFTDGAGAPAPVAADLAMPVDCFQHMVAGLVGGGSHGQLQLHFVGDDVVLCAAVDRADGDHRRNARFDLAADDRLQTENDACGQDNRVDTVVRSRAVATDAHGL